MIYSESDQLQFSNLSLLRDISSNSGRAVLSRSHIQKVYRIGVIRLVVAQKVRIAHG
jgi:hypothetical protein